MSESEAEGDDDEFSTYYQNLFRRDEIVNVFEDEIDEEFAGGMYPQSEDEGVTSMGETTDCDTD